MKLRLFSTEMRGRAVEVYGFKVIDFASVLDWEDVSRCGVGWVAFICNCVRIWGAEIDA